MTNARAQRITLIESFAQKSFILHTAALFTVTMAVAVASSGDDDGGTVVVLVVVCFDV